MGGEHKPGHHRGTSTALVHKANPQKKKYYHYKLYRIDDGRKVKE